jgi:hypothetical protein
MKRRHDLVQDRITAHHESGHGCAAIALGLKFTSIDIVSSQKEHRLGRIDWPQDLWRALNEEFNRSDPNFIDQVRRRIVSTFSGIEAQRRFAPWTDLRHDSSSDRDCADEWIQRLLKGPPDPGDPYLWPHKVDTSYYDDETGDYYGDFEILPPEGPEPSAADIAANSNARWYPPDRLVDRQTLDLHYARFRLRAAALVGRLWPKIQIVAAALLKKKVLSYDEVRRLINRARRTKEFSR